MDDQQLKAVVEKIRERYDGEMSLLEAGGVEIIAGPPDRATFARFQDMILDTKKRGKAFEALLRSCLLYPSFADLESIVEHRPGLVVTFAEKVAEMGGAGAVVEEKKL